MELCWAVRLCWARFPHNKLRDVLMRDVFLVTVGNNGRERDERSTRGVSGEGQSDLGELQLSAVLIVNN